MNLFANPSKPITMKYLDAESAGNSIATVSYLPDRNGRRFSSSSQLLPETRRSGTFADDRLVALPRHIIARALETPSLNNLLPSAAGRCSNVVSELGGPAGLPDQTLLIYCSRGRGWCEMRGRRHDVGVGELLVIPAGTPHSYGADSERLWAVSWLQVAGQNLPFALHQLGVSVERPVIELGNDTRPGALFQELLETIEEGNSPSHLMRASQTLTRLFEVINERHSGAPFGEPDCAQKIRQSIAYMKQRLDRPLQVSALATQANVSQSHYFAIFKRLTGFTPIDYFIHLRMERACHLLKTTAASVKEVAGALGYDDPFYFSRVFRSVQGVAPSEYRLLSCGMDLPARRRSGPTKHAEVAKLDRHVSEINLQ